MPPAFLLVRPILPLNAREYTGGDQSAANQHVGPRLWSVRRKRASASC